MEVKEIIELMKAMSENGMTGFELEEGDWKLSMKREKKIVAAAQTATLGEDDGTDAGTIMHGIFLDIENEAARVVVFDHGVTAGEVEG